MITYKEVFALAEDKGYQIQYDHKPKRLGTAVGLANHSENVYLECCLIQTWLRVSNHIHVWLSPDYAVVFSTMPTYGWDLDTFTIPARTNSRGGIQTYEQALLEGVYEGLKLIG